MYRTVYAALLCTYKNIYMKLNYYVGVFYTFYIVTKDFKLFLTNEMNKKQLCNLLIKTWSDIRSYSSLKNCETAILIVDGKAYSFKASDDRITCNEIFSMNSNQEETDTRVVLYIDYAQKCGFKNAVIRTPDTDIFFILLFHAHDFNLEIFLDLDKNNIFFLSKWF